MAMAAWIDYWLDQETPDGDTDAHSAANGVRNQIRFAHHKPPALVTIDDRALTFDGTWPTMDEIKNFKPWNKRVIKD